MNRLFKWFPIFVEPIYNSGERICSLLVVESDGTNVDVLNVFANERMKGVLGAKLTSFLRILSMLDRDLKDFYTENKSFDGWVPPVEGVEMGLTREIEASGLSEVLAHAEMFVSFLVDPKAFAKDEIRVNELRFYSFIKDVKSGVLSEKPLWREKFNFRFKDKRKEFSVDFLHSPILAANFSYLADGNYLEPSYNKTLRRFLELDLLTRRFDLERSVQYVRIPRFEDLTRNMKANIESKIETIEDFTSGQKISAKTVHYAREVTQDLLGNVR